MSGPSPLSDEVDKEKIQATIQERRTEARAAESHGVEGQEKKIAITGHSN